MFFVPQTSIQRTFIDLLKKKVWQAQDPNDLLFWLLAYQIPICMYIFLENMPYCSKRSCCSTKFFFLVQLYYFKKNLPFLLLNSQSFSVLKHVYCSKIKLLFLRLNSLPFLFVLELLFLVPNSLYLSLCCRTSWTSRRRSCWRRTGACAPPPTWRWPPRTPPSSRSTQTSSDTITSR